MEPRKTPVRRHLPPTRAGIVSSAHRLQKHVVGRNTQPQAKRAIAIIRIKPVVTRFEREGGGDSDSLMAGARDLEENFLLTLQHDLPVVYTPGGVHDPVGLGQLLAGKTFVGLARLLNVAVGYSGRFGIGLGRHAQMHCKSRYGVPNILDLREDYFLRE